MTRFHGFTSKYGKLPYFYYSCGRLRHGDSMKDCAESGSFEDEDNGEVRFGEWLRVSSFKKGRVVLEFQIRQRSKIGL